MRFRAQYRGFCLRFLPQFAGDSTSDVLLRVSIGDPFHLSSIIEHDRLLGLD